MSNREIRRANGIRGGISVEVYYVIKDRKLYLEMRYRSGKDILFEQGFSHEDVKRWNEELEEYGKKNAEALDEYGENNEI